MEKLYLKALLSFSLLIPGCERIPLPQEKVVFSGVAMTVPYQVAIRKSLTLEEQALVELKIAEIFQETHQVFNKFNPDSELSSINELGKDISYAPSPQLYALFERTNTYVMQSGGLFDPTIETKESHARGWKHLRLNNGSLEKTFDETAFDLGGIAKGTTIDNLLKGMNILGYPSVLVEWGGDFAVSTLSTDDAPWRIALKDQDEIVDIWKGGLATSGDYVQFWTDDKNTFFHLFHPLENRFLSQQEGHVTSVSVKGKNAEEADVLATIFLLMETEENGKKFLSDLQRDDISVWWKTR